MYAAEKFVKESGEKLEAADRMAIESATNDVKKALESNDAKAINRTLDALMQAQQKAAEPLDAPCIPSLVPDSASTATFPPWSRRGANL